MKYLLVLILMFFSFAFAQSFLEADYNFIDSAFDGIKPVTNKEFNDTINKLTPQPVENTFGAKLKAFLFGRKYGVQPPPAVGQEEKIDSGGDKEAIERLTKGIYYIRLTAPILAENNAIIPIGNYKIFERTINNCPMLLFYQGYKEYGMLKLKKYEDNLKNENDIAYSRVDVVSDDIIRIVYSTISDTKCALAKVYLQN